MRLLDVSPANGDDTNEVDEQVALSVTRQELAILAAAVRETLDALGSYPSARAVKGSSVRCSSPTESSTIRSGRGEVFSDREVAN
jgi:hypothetical protein